MICHLGFGPSSRRPYPSKHDLSGYAVSWPSRLTCMHGRSGSELYNQADQAPQPCFAVFEVGNDMKLTAKPSYARQPDFVVPTETQQRLPGFPVVPETY